MKTLRVDELSQWVPMNDGCYVRLIDIPNPYRSEFIADSIGSTCPVILNEGICHYVGDWERWLWFRLQADYRLRHAGSYQEISDEAQRLRDEQHKLRFNTQKIE